MPDQHPDTTIPPSIAGSTPVGPFAVRWEEYGSEDAPLLVLLHGIYAGASGYEWRSVVPLLAEHHRVRVPDILGLGASDRPDMEWTPEVLTDVVAAIIDDAVRSDAGAVVVASSLTGAHAVRALQDQPDVPLVLITPTGLGSAQTSPSGKLGRALYSVGRHTPIGDLFVYALSSGPSVRWFQRNQTYRDPDVLTEAEVEQTRTTARMPNAKHLQLAFVANRLGVRLDPSDVAAIAPRVLWGSGQGFVDDADPDRWRAAGASVLVVDDGLPQVESPEATATFISGSD